MTLHCNASETWTFVYHCLSVTDKAIFYAHTVALWLSLFWKECLIFFFFTCESALRICIEFKCTFKKGIKSDFTLFGLLSFLNWESLGTLCVIFQTCNNCEECIAVTLKEKSNSSSWNLDSNRNMLDVFLPSGSYCLYSHTDNYPLCYFKFLCRILSTIEEILIIFPRGNRVRSFWSRWMKSFCEWRLFLPCVQRSLKRRLSCLNSSFRE